MSKHIKSSVSKGFTLVELSIVIVIIGFLVAGIAAGSNMIKQAQLRSVMSDLENYQTAINNFNSKYGKLPGDIDTATSFWPSDGQCLETVLGNEDVCNGDNNGRVNADDPTAGPDETRPALKHLALAGMISAGIPVVPTTIVALVPGVNAPASKISGAGYFIASSGGPIQATLVGLGRSSGIAGGVLSFGSMTPEDAFNIDQKIDDGSIVNGNFQGALSGNFGSFDGQDVLLAADCSNFTTGFYTMSTDYLACGIFWKLKRF